MSFVQRFWVLLGGYIGIGTLGPGMDGGGTHIFGGLKMLSGDAMQRVYFLMIDV